MQKKNNHNKCNKCIIPMIRTSPISFVSSVRQSNQMLVYSPETKTGMIFPPPGLPITFNSIVIEMWGGGGSGQSGPNTTDGVIGQPVGGGGGGGAYAKFSIPWIAGNVLTINTGTGGVSPAATSYANGINGGSTSVVSINPSLNVIAGGGSGGGVLSGPGGGGNGGSFTFIGSSFAPEKGYSSRGQRGFPSELIQSIITADSSQAISARSGSGGDSTSGGNGGTPFVGNGISGTLSGAGGSGGGFFNLVPPPIQPPNITIGGSGANGQVIIYY